MLKKDKMVSCGAPGCTKWQKQSPGAVLKNFTKFIGEHQMFSCEFGEIFKNTFFYTTPLVGALGDKNSKTITLVTIIMLL